MTNLHENFAKLLRSSLDEPGSREQLEACLRLLAKWRTILIEHTIKHECGSTVQSGPFIGMKYVEQSSEGSLSARLIGSYEASLRPAVEEIVVGGYEQVIDIGSSDGYYAVGLAMRMPHAQIFAHDQNEKAQEGCKHVAEQNNLADRVHVGGLFLHGDFDVCMSKKTAVICDIEGAELELIDPIRAPGLLHADILVETHEVFSKDICAEITSRFEATHSITRIDRELDASYLPKVFDDLSDLDRLLALWEWREGPTPWLWMVKK